jgi:hypothetical protein
MFLLPRLACLQQVFFLFVLRLLIFIVNLNNSYLLNINFSIIFLFYCFILTLSLIIVFMSCKYCMSFFYEFPFILKIFSYFINLLIFLPILQVFVLLGSILLFVRCFCFVTISYWTWTWQFLFVLNYEFMSMLDMYYLHFTLFLLGLMLFSYFNSWDLYLCFLFGFTIS